MIINSVSSWPRTMQNKELTY